MSADQKTHRARRWLSEQIDQLKTLRNASTRDQEFKQWRQSTLTVVQRIWEADRVHSERFKRIPFTPPSSRADPRENREYYERGCAEALRLLQGLLEEVEQRGMPDVKSPHTREQADESLEERYPSLGLGEGADGTPAKLESGGNDAADDKPASGRKKNGRKSVKKRLRDMLGLSDLEAAANTEAAPAEPVENVDDGAGSSADAADAPAVGSAQVTPDVERDDEIAVPGSDRDVQERVEFESDIREELEETLKFYDTGTDAETGPRADRGSAPPPTRSARREARPAAKSERKVPPAAEPDPELEVVQAITPADEPVVEEEPAPVADVEPEAAPVIDDETASAPAADATPAAELAAERVSREAADAKPAAGRKPAPAEPEPAAPAAEEDDLQTLSADDFLSASPVFRAKAKPVRRAKENAQPTPAEFELEAYTSPTAVAVASIAAEVARLGVPEAHRARTRTALLDLAGLVESGQLDWDALRGAVGFAMEFPAVGRRVLPLLIPFIDKAA